jgi:hypothetical protein
MSTNIIVLGAFFVVVATMIFFIVRLEMRMRKLFRGKKAQDLESIMQDIALAVDNLEEIADTHKEALEHLRARLQKEGRGVELVRFNPFTDVGGNQSFAVAIVNEDGDGVVFSSLYSRERQSIFAKPVRAGVSDIELSEEEAAVIKDAIDRVRTA